MTILSLHEAQNGPFSIDFLIKNAHSEFHEAQAQNAPFPIDFLIKNDYSEPPRGAGMVHSQLTFLLKINILSLHAAQAPNG